MGIFIDRFAKP